MQNNSKYNFLVFCGLAIALLFTLHLFKSTKADNVSIQNITKPQNSFNPQTKAYTQKDWISPQFLNDNTYALHDIFLERKTERSDTALRHEETRETEFDENDDSEAGIDYEGFFAFATRCIDTNDLDSLREEYNKLISSYPEKMELYQNLANFFMERSLPQEAGEILFTALDNNPTTKEFYYLAGDFYVMYDLYDDAIYFYNQALTLDNQEAAGYYKLSEIYQKLGDNQLADTYSGYYASLIQQ